MKRTFNFHDLRIFYTVVTTGGARQASHVLHLTQPAISHAITRLEVATGVLLFDRQNRALKPTAAGRYLFEEARGILGELARIDDELHMIDQFGDRSLQLAVTPGLALKFMAEVLQRYLADTGQRPVALNMTSSAQADTVVETGGADMAVGAVRKENVGVSFHAFVRSEVVAVLANRHDLANAKVIDPESIDPATFIKPLWSNYVASQGDQLPPMPYWSGIQAHMSLLPSMLEEFGGISFINALTASDIVAAYPNLSVRPLTSRQWFEYYLIARKGTEGTEAYERMRSALEQIVAERRVGVFEDVLTLLT